MELRKLILEMILLALEEATLVSINTKTSGI